METTISIVGGVGLFLLGMAVMTDGLKALAGTALKTVMEKAAATPLLGTFWGAVITLIVQSSSATTMTTIGLVSAGLLTFPQGLSLVFGANIGTTGTGWLVAAFGVRISLSAAAFSITVFRAVPARALSPSVITAMPRRNRPTPPTIEIVVSKCPPVHCVFVHSGNMHP